MKTFLNYEEAVEALEYYDLEEIERKIGVLQRETLQENSNPEEKAFIAYDFNKSYKYWVKKLNDYINIVGVSDSEKVYMQQVAYMTVYAEKVKSLRDRYARMYNVKF